MPESLKSIESRNQIHYSYMMRLLNRMYPGDTGRRLLDFGCGGGQFLIEAATAGFDIFGLEINEDLAGFVKREYGFRIHCGVVTDSEFSTEKFDFIISSQVFEHLVNPAGCLEELVHHLNRPGVMLIEVPNLRHFSESVRKGSTMDDSHLFYFDAKSLSRMMERAGLRVAKVQQGLRPYRVLPSSFPKLPDRVHDLMIGALGSVGLRTGLSIIAVKT